MPEPPPAALEVPATVIEALPSALYRVELLSEGRPRVVAHVGPEASLLRVRPGDAVVVALASYDAARGRIVRKRD